MCALWLVNQPVRLETSLLCHEHVRDTYLILEESKLDVVDVAEEGDRKAATWKAFTTMQVKSGGNLAVYDSAASSSEEQL